ncbi:hypothetical protein [Lactobacillus terrae]|uniref:hypothetical protein n=1 Tax=Lactobacillus terrae TaxID=2269374 RepID=UPI000C1B794E|nr:hypothetical protein [Lactobacillus terrae]
MTSVSAALPVLNVKADVEEPTSETTEVNNETIDSYSLIPTWGHDDKKDLPTEIGKVNAKLASQYGLKTVPALHGLLKSGLIDSYQNGVSNTIKFETLKDSDLFKLQKAALSETASVKFLDQKNVKVQLSVRSIDKTKKVVNLDDIKNIDKAKQGFYVTINFLDSEGKSIAKSAELKYSTLSEVAATDFKEMNVSYTSPVKVGVGSSIKSVMDPKKSDLKVVLNKKGLATNAKVDMGKIYSTEAEAVKNTGRGILTSPIGKFSKFTKNNATYYQNVTVSVNDDKVKSLIKRVLLNEEGFSVTASDKIASIAENEMHFVRKISVVDATTTPDTTDPEEPETTDSAWKESSVSGIVTTGKKDYYTLVNGENKPVANRALGGNN